MIVIETSVDHIVMIKYRIELSTESLSKPQSKL